jgi:alkanesulfonate monooxygenase SsuD/methylene tetrahydromethanopterin reductase-like flavin-dependent oxidoreductase (luciferase family)
MVTAAPGCSLGPMTTFGLHLTSYPGPDAGSIAAYARDVAVAAEDSGVFGTLWLTDHVQNPGPAAPAPESHLVLANVAAVTQRLDLGLLATSVVYRNPALLAKMITTVDVLSGGRAILGIGAGHPRTQAEAESYGYPFPPVRARPA